MGIAYLENVYVKRLTPQWPSSLTLTSEKLIGPSYPQGHILSKFGPVVFSGILTNK